MWWPVFTSSHARVSPKTKKYKKKNQRCERQKRLFGSFHFANLVSFFDTAVPCCPRLQAANGCDLVLSRPWKSRILMQVVVDIANATFGRAWGHEAAGENRRRDRWSYGHWMGHRSALAREGCRVAIAGRRADNCARPRRVGVGRRRSCGIRLTWPIARASPSCSSGPNRPWALDILVNSAGINIANRSMATMQPEQWDQILAINATGAYNCLYYALPQMRARKDGLVINVSSISGKCRWRWEALPIALPSSP